MIKKTIQLETHLSLKNVEKLLKEWKCLLSEDTNLLHIDSSHMKTFDGPGIQLVLALIKQAHQQHILVEWNNIRDEVKIQLNILGVTDRLIEMDCHI
jgi:ABC-type transporter Mla MlaB component